MPDLSPSETLRAAAEKLRELAEHATPGPWQPCENPSGTVGVDIKPTDRAVLARWRELRALVVPSSASVAPQTEETER